MTPESQTNGSVSSWVDVWGVEEVAFVQRTVSPTSPMASLGEKKKFMIETSLVNASAEPCIHTARTTASGRTRPSTRFMGTPLSEARVQDSYERAARADFGRTQNLGC